MDIDRPWPQWTTAGTTAAQLPTRKTLMEKHHNLEVPSSMLNSLSISSTHRRTKKGGNSSSTATRAMPSAAGKQPSGFWRMFGNPQTPHVLIGYVQLIFNMSIAAIVLYVLASFVLIVRRDIDGRATAHRLKLAQEIALCGKLYGENRCSPETRAPALEQKCREWEAGMQRHPEDVGGGRVLAETVADIVNGLVEPISVKSLVFIAAALFGSLFMSNYAFGLARFRLGHRTAAAATPTVHITSDPVPRHRMIAFREATVVNNDSNIDDDCDDD